MDCPKQPTKCKDCERTGFDQQDIVGVTDTHELAIIEDKETTARVRLVRQRCFLLHDKVLARSAGKAKIHCHARKARCFAPMCIVSAKRHMMHAMGYVTWIFCRR